MRQERRILLEAVIVSVLGHAIFFSVFTAKRAEPAGPQGRAHTIAFEAQTADRRAALDPAVGTTNPSDPEHAARLRSERRTVTPLLEADRTVFFPEDEPDLGPPPTPTVGPESWAFGKEPARLRDEFDADFDAAPALDAARESISGNGSDEPPLSYTFDVPFIRLPQAGVLRLGPEKTEGPDVRTFRSRITLNPATRKFDYTYRSSGDPQIDAAMIREIQRWRFKHEPTAEGHRLLAWLPLPRLVQGTTSKHEPPPADEVYGDEP